MMDAQYSTSARPAGRRLLRAAAWFLLVPLLAVIAAGILLSVQIDRYQQAHDGKIYTGISVAEVEIGGLTPEDALTTLRASQPPMLSQQIALSDQTTGLQWQYDLAALGVAYDFESAIEHAYQIGRRGTLRDRLQQQFYSWYHGVDIAPNVVVDEAEVDRVIGNVAEQVERDALNATLNVDGQEVGFTTAQIGRHLNRARLRNELLQPVVTMQAAQIDLPIDEVIPQVMEAGAPAEEIQQILSGPITFYLQTPIDSADLQPVTLPAATLANWLRVQWQEESVDGATSYEVLIDEVAARNWIAQHASALYREPERARYYFDDFTEELVLIEPHSDGRELDVDATLAALTQVIDTPDRVVPFVVRNIVPEVHSNATAAELGITELITSATTYFAGSPPERMANIARAAANFYGIVVAPGEEFSFNHYLGPITEDMGYRPALIIFGGRTIEGVGGGVCQVSTTLFQAAFWGGFDITERHQHAYRVHYYEDGYGPDGKPNVGMDATVFNGEEIQIDLKFVNNTPHHLLIENYYNEGNESLTFKMYSTSLGRAVERDLYIWNETPPRPDRYEYNPEVTEDYPLQVDWAVGGADVQVHRRVYNQWGGLRDEEFHNSEYIPWANIYEYGDNFTPPPTPAPTVPPSPTPEETATPEGETPPPEASPPADDASGEAQP